MDMLTYRKLLQGLKSRRYIIQGQTNLDLAAPQVNRSER